MQISLIVADDRPAIINRVQHELVNFRTISVEGIASDMTDTLSLLGDSLCDVLIINLMVLGSDIGDCLTMLSLLQQRHPDVKIIVLTAIHSREIVMEVVRVGAQGVLREADIADHVISAIHAVYAGATYLSPTFCMSPEDEKEAQMALARKLSLREKEVLRLYVSGLSVSEISNRLNRSKGTISTQKASAMRKLGVERNADLFRLAQETGLFAVGGGKPEGSG